MNIYIHSYGKIIYFTYFDTKFYLLIRLTFLLFLKKAYQPLSNTGDIFATLPFTLDGQELPYFSKTARLSRFFFTLHIKR